MTTTSRNQRAGTRRTSASTLELLTDLVLLENEEVGYLLKLQVSADMHIIFNDSSVALRRNSRVQGCSPGGANELDSETWTLWGEGDDDVSQRRLTLFQFFEKTQEHLSSLFDKIEICAAFLFFITHNSERIVSPSFPE